jgi:hypothetical protein
VLVMMMSRHTGECEMAEASEVKPFWLAENLRARIKQAVDGESQYI